MGAALTERDAFRLRILHAGLLALVVALAVGLIRPGASWGSSAYDPAGDPYSMQNITASDGVQAWWNAGVTGQGVDVALIDTGTASVPALSGADKVVNGPDLSLESQDPSLQHLDGNGHGTFMAGIIGGNDGLPSGYRGVAPGARILSVKVGDADGGVDVSQVIAAIDWVVQHRHEHGLDIRVINLSYGTNSSQPYTLDPLAFAAERAWEKGIVVVAAAGNRGSGGGLADPAYDPWLISVGAADTMGSSSLGDDAPASFTSGAACVTCAAPTLLAPGMHMQGLRVPGSYIDENYPGAALGDLYFRGSGTSEAAAYVSGVVALLLQKYPRLTPDQVKQLLIAGAQPLPGASPLVQGSGELDLSTLLGVPGRLRAAGRGPGGPDGPEPATGRGLLQLSRGNDVLAERRQAGGREGHLREAVQGSAHGRPRGRGPQLVGRQMERLQLGGKLLERQSWSGSSWSTLSWSGSSWSGSSWSGSSWSGSSWSGDAWSSFSW